MVIIPLLALLVMLWILVRQLKSQRKRKSRRSSTSSQPVSVNLALPAPVHHGSTTDTISSTTGVFGDSYNPYDPYDPYASSTGSTAGPEEIAWTCPTCGTTNVTGYHANWLQNQQAAYYHDATDCPKCMTQAEKTKRRARRERGAVRGECLDRYLEQQPAYDNTYNNTPQPGLGQYCYRYRYRQKDEYWCNPQTNQIEANSDALTGWPGLNGLPPVYRRDIRGGNGLVDAFTFQTA